MTLTLACSGLACACSSSVASPLLMAPSPGVRAALSANDVATALHDSGIPISRISFLRDKLSPPPPLSSGEFTDSVSFTDSRVGATAIVEVYASDQAARERCGGLADSGAAEHDLVSGDVVLRLPSALDDHATTGYEQALEAVTGREVDRR